MPIYYLVCIYLLALMYGLHRGSINVYKPVVLLELISLKSQLFALMVIIYLI